LGRSGLVLVALSVVEQRLDAVRAVLAGATVTEVARKVGVSRQTLHSWLSRYLATGVAGLVDRSRRPNSCPHRCSSDVEVVVVEMRRKHPHWGAKRIRMQLLKAGGAAVVPAERTINRILSRHGLLDHKTRKRRRESFKRWQREAPMQLWQMDIVGGVMIVDAASGQVREAKVVTGVDDHSRYCVIAKVVARATGRAVCLALAEALAKFGVPEEILTDNGKQFTDRFGNGGEVLFDKICRLNGIAHRLTAPASPTTTGKVERFHLTLRRELLDGHVLFDSLVAAQAAVDAFVADYNTDRPHQGLDETLPVSPQQRFTPTPQTERALLELWVPPTLAPAVAPGPVEDTAGETLTPGEWHGGPIEFDKIVPPSGNMSVAHKQFWLGPARAGLVARFWADCDLIHVSIGGARIKTVRSHLSTTDLAKLIASGAVPAGPAPLPGIEDGAALEVERVVSSCGLISLANKQILVAERLAGMLVCVRIEQQTLLFFDPTTRELLRTRPNPLTRDQVLRLRGLRPAGPPPRPSQEPIRIQRRASDTGVIMVAGQKIALGRTHRGQEVEILVSEITLAIHLPGRDVRVVRRTTTKPIRNIKADRPRTVPSVS
jgi:transposase InsO family protein